MNLYSFGGPAENLQMGGARFEGFNGNAIKDALTVPNPQDVLTHIAPFSLFDDLV